MLSKNKFSKKAIKERLKILESVLQFNKPIDSLINEVSKLDLWDNEPIILLRISHIKRILDGYIKNKYSSKDLFKWFNLIELKDEFKYGESEEEHDKISDIIEELSNDKINFLSEEDLYQRIIFILKCL